MKRIDIFYGGERYSVGQRTLEDIRREVELILDAGQGWLMVNDGDGAPRTAYLLITEGVALSVVPIPDEDPDATPTIDDISDRLVSS